MTEALAGSARFHGVQVLRAEPHVIGVGYGLDGIVARVTLVTDGASPGTPASVVMKLARGERGRAEIAFYERIAPRMPIRLPRYDAGFVSDDGEHAVLLVEDLTGAVQGDTVAGASRVQTEAVLRAMARFHAAFAGARDAVLAELRPWPGRGEGLVERLRDRMPRFLERYATHLDEHALRLVQGLADRLPAAVDLLQAVPPTLIHADLHVDNVLFLERHVPVILDWPDACRGPAMVDVVRFLVEGTRADVRRRHGARFLDAYGRDRAEAGAPLTSPAQTAREYEAAVLYYLAHSVAWAGAEDPGFGTPRVREIVDTLVHNATAAAIDL